MSARPSTARAVAPVARPSSTITTLLPPSSTRRKAPAVGGGAAGDLVLLLRDRASQVRRIHLHPLQQIAIPDLHARRDGAHRELPVGGRSDLPGHDHVHGNTERGAHALGHQHATPRDPQDHRVGEPQLRQLDAQAPPRVVAIAEHHPDDDAPGHRARRVAPRREPGLAWRPRRARRPRRILTWCRRTS